jgi:hypothetical protein
MYVSVPLVPEKCVAKWESVSSSIYFGRVGKASKQALFFLSQGGGKGLPREQVRG